MSKPCRAMSFKDCTCLSRKHVNRALTYRMVTATLAALLALVPLPSASQASGKSSSPVVASKAATKILVGAGYRYSMSGRYITILGCSNVCPKSMIIPKQIGSGIVVAIGEGAFEYGRSERVQIPDTVTSVAKKAFFANSLQSVSFGKALKSIGEAAFSRNSLKTLSLNNAIQEIGVAAFASNFLTDVSFPSTITKIGLEAFAGNKLVSATFLGNAPSQGSKALHWHTKAQGPGVNEAGTTVVYALNKAKGWGATWSGIPVQKLDSIDFLSYTTASKKVTITGCKKTCPKFLVIPDKIAGNSVTSIANQAFKNAKLTSVAVPETLTKFGSSSFSGADIGSFYFRGNAPSLDVDSLASISESTKIRLAWNSDNWGDMWAEKDIEVDQGPFNTTEDDQGNLTLTSCITHCDSHLVFPSKIRGKTVRRLGQFQDSGRPSFGDAGLLSVRIPSSVTDIAAGSFASNELTNVALPSSILSIGLNAFAYNKITSVKLPEQSNIFGRDVFIHNKITQIEIPSSWTEIPEGFLAHNALTKIQLPSKLEVIGAYALSYNKLISVSIPASVREIGDAAFMGNEITKLPALPKELTVFKSWFAENQIKSISIPSGFTVIDHNAFYQMGLTSIKIPDSITSIGLGAFQNNLLVTVTIPKSVTSIASFAFQNNKLKSFKFEGNAPIVVTGPEIYPWLGPRDFPAEPSMFLGNSSLKEVTVKVGSTGWSDKWSGLTVKVVP